MEIIDVVGTFAPQRKPQEQVYLRVAFALQDWLF
jgi:ribosomal protein S16